jgi:curved DNA-binding protein CbpA
MKNRRNYYRILKVQPDAPVEIIRASYRTLMRELKLHPDLGGSTYDASLLNEAYETLSNSARRAAYDEKTHVRNFRRNEPVSNPDSPPAAILCPFCRTQLTRQAQEREICPSCNVPLPSSKPAESDPASRRTIARIKKNDPITYAHSFPEVPGEGKLLDLSPKGMRFICSARLDPGTILKITSPLLTACGIVTYQQREQGEDKSSYAIGVSFLAVKFEETKGSFVSVSA